jgi:WD40 repeat protein
MCDDVVEPQSLLTIRGQYEILTCDWNKYNENILVSGSVDKTIKIWVHYQNLTSFLFCYCSILLKKKHFN